MPKIMLLIYSQLFLKYLMMFNLIQIYFFPEISILRNLEAQLLHGTKHEPGPHILVPLTFSFSSSPFFIIIF